MTIKKARISGVRLLMFLALFSIVFPPSAFAIDLYLFSAVNASTESASPLFVEAGAGLSHEGDNFSIAWKLALDDAGTYKAPYFGDYFGDFSVEADRAEIGLRGAGFSATLGRSPLEDIVESPYSLFQNASDISTLGATVSYEDDRFFFHDRWVLLNRNLVTTIYTTSSRDDGLITEDPDIYDDRGAVLKTYGMKKGNFRFGFQDSAVFTGDFFDIGYFANPLPSIFVQYIDKAPGRPWTVAEGDDNTIMGFFADYADEKYYLYGQILVDDINMNRFLNPSAKQNPDKIAWSLGGRMKSSLGTFGLYQAGATKYTFQSAQKEYYSYTLYPGSVVLWKGTETPIPIEENMLGYLHGENNISLLGTWNRSFGKIDAAASLELSLSGSKSPANPWNEYDVLEKAIYGTKLLDDPVLEKKIVLGAEAGLPLGDFYVGIGGQVGYVGNRLQAVDAPISDEGAVGNAQPLFKPSADSGFIGAITIFGRYTLHP